MRSSKHPIASSLRTASSSTCVQHRHKKELSDGADRYFIAKVWKNRVNDRTNVSKWCPKIQLKERSSRSFAAPTQPAVIREWAEWGVHITSCLCVPPCKVRAGSACVRNLSCQQGWVRHTNRILALQSCTEKIQTVSGNPPCMKTSIHCGPKACHVAAEAGDVAQSFTWNSKMLASDKLYWQIALLCTVNHAGNTSDRERYSK